ncbi:MAG: type II toxin-antitoxin system prevent-host-death family antitoxin [Actinomycetota bacterium]|nr:type II toxin-antitoxin system prevent-host-death family antitoxin [Actinomycetota bacterium]
MNTIGLRELNQNPSKAVARVRAGETIVVTDRGHPVMRLVPERDLPDSVATLFEAGAIQVPDQLGVPEPIDELDALGTNLADLIVADRARERVR